MRLLTFLSALFLLLAQSCSDLACVTASTPDLHMQELEGPSSTPRGSTYDVKCTFKNATDVEMADCTGDLITNSSATSIPCTGTVYYAYSPVYTRDEANFTIYDKQTFVIPAFEAGRTQIDYMPIETFATGTICITVEVDSYGENRDPNISNNFKTVMTDVH